MSDERGMVAYKAADGQDVKLTPGMVQKYIISGNAQASDKDVFRFMAQCQARGLNPLAGDAYMTTYRSQDGTTNSSVVVSKDYYLRTAAAQPDFDGIEAGVVVAKKDGSLEYRAGSLVGGQTERLVGGWARVYSKNRSHPSEAVVSMEEYDQKRSLWRSKPATMIRKVALVQALREAWPGLFGGIYDQDEMPEPVAPIPQEPLEVLVAEDTREARSRLVQAERAYAEAFGMSFNDVHTETVGSRSYEDTVEYLTKRANELEEKAAKALIESEELYEEEVVF